MVMGLPTAQSSKILDEFFEELIRAFEKHGDLPDDIIHAVAIMQEEAGEAVRAAIQATYESKSPLDREVTMIPKIRKELVQTGAMCLKCILQIDRGDFT